MIRAAPLLVLLALAAPTAAQTGGARFDIVRITPGGRALLAGHAPPGARVEVFADHRSLGTATADGSGSWLLLPQKPLPPGATERRFSVRLLPPPAR
ncbi:MAG: hypothetical protein KGI51_13330 [Rhodospirillales bacterium]|nr:hypothetical protein [Rhodospirillales bacterium]